MDRFILSKEPKIEEQQKRFVIDLIDTDVVVKNKKMFYINSVAIIITIILFAILPLLYLTAAISAYEKGDERNVKRYRMGDNFLFYCVIRCYRVLN